MKQIIPGRVSMTKDSFEPIFKDGSLVIGQDQDNLGKYGGGFDARQAFSGELAQLEIWNEELSISDIEKIANCKIMSVMESYKVVSWFSEKWETNNVELKDITMENLCMDNPGDFSFGYIDTSLNSKVALWENILASKTSTLGNICNYLQ